MKFTFSEAEVIRGLSLVAKEMGIQGNINNVEFVKGRKTKDASGAEIAPELTALVDIGAVAIKEAPVDKPEAKPKESSEAQDTTDAEPPGDAAPTPSLFGNTEIEASS